MRHVLSLRQLRLGLREPSRKAVARSARLLDQFGQRLGRAWRETDEADTDFEALIRDLLEGQYNNPVRVVAFNTAEVFPAMFPMT